MERNSGFRFRETDFGAGSGVRADIARVCKDTRYFYLMPDGRSDG
jgi:hypothetical protein